MSDTAELEIGLYPRDADSYTIELRYLDPDDEATRAPERGVVRFDLAQLRASRLDPAASGELLSQSLFHDPHVRAYFDQARAAAQSSGKALRLRLYLDSGAGALHDLRWELLRDPQDGSWLLADEKMPFSRYMSSSNWEKVQLRAFSELRVLVVVANPVDLAEEKYEIEGQSLAPVDVAGEVGRIQESLAPLKPDILASDPGNPGQASLATFFDRLRQGYDIVYLVAHGALLKREPAGPYLWLEGDEGGTAVTPGEALVERLKDLPAGLRPRLMVLASCQSAGTAAELRASDFQGALAALGPRLAQAGIPAVVAMQGDVSMKTVAQFMPTFFSELVRAGQVDRAVAAARSRVRERPDAWMPVLFLRLRAGMIWYTPGFGKDVRGFDKWRSLLRFIKSGQCTPVLGPDLYEAILGSQREIALRWAEIYNYPLQIQERDSLPQVAQFLAVNQYEHAAVHELQEYLKLMLKTRFRDQINPELPGNQADLDRLLETVGMHLQAQDERAPYRVLAHLPLPVYITTNGNNLMAAALRAAGKDPQVVMCPWNDHIAGLHTIYNREPDYEPTPARPLVYHLFGRLDDADSYVLKEDDYFDFLIGVTRNRSLIPEKVRSALADSALLFLGFQIDDWQFRVLFRSIVALEGGDRRRNYPNIAAQIQPDENRALEPERARKYLETYYFQDANLSLYWGSVDDFMRELWPRWQEFNRSNGQ
jgi:hypothetical protein